MSKGKQGPALFDLLDAKRSETPRVLRVPGWYTAGEGENPPPEDAETLVADEAPRPQPRPFLTHEDGRIVLSLTSTVAGLSVFAALVLLVSAFVVGKGMGSEEGLVRGYREGRVAVDAPVGDEIDAARNQPPASHLVQSVLEPAPRAAERPRSNATPGVAEVPKTDVRNAALEGGARAAGAGSWVRDYTYVLAQEFSAGNVAHADAAQAYLAQHGVEAVIVRSGAGVQLITAQGYNFKDPAQKRLGEQLLQKVHAVGRKYYDAGGGYRMEGYFKTLKGDGW